jgi:DNA-binding transcriptional ArsR family regulator
MKLNDKTHAMDLTMTALAHPTRRAILERVMRRETRVTELAEPFAISLNAVSKHIRILERARLVRRRRVWREHLVSYNPVPLEEVAAWIERQRRFWNESLDALEALLKAEDAAVAQKSDEKGQAK